MWNKACHNSCYIYNAKDYELKPYKNLFQLALASAQNQGTSHSYYSATILSSQQNYEYLSSASNSHKYSLLYSQDITRLSSTLTYTHIASIQSALHYLSLFTHQSPNGQVSHSPRSVSHTLVYRRYSWWSSYPTTGTRQYPVFRESGLCLAY